MSVRVRIIDPAFREMSRADRSDLVWNYFDALSEEVQSDISMLVLLTPSESETIDWRTWNSRIRSVRL